MAISDLERRVIAHLAIPRNVADLYGELTRDVNSPVGPATPQRMIDHGQGLRAEADVDRYLREHLAESGYVVKINPTDDVAHLAVKPPKSAYPWHEESREIFASRLAQPARKWRVSGDLWILSANGLDALKEPTAYAPDLSLDQLQGAIDREYGRIGKDLTDEEYGNWLAQTLEFYDAQYPDIRKAVRLPVGGGAGWTDVFENRIIDQENQKTLMPALVDPWFMALTILAFTDTDTGTTADDGSHIPSYTGYARKSVAASLMSAASGGSSNNSGGAITFAACTAGSSTIVGFGNCSTSTAGELRKYGTCSNTSISTTQTPATFNTGAYVTTAD